MTRRSTETRAQIAEEAAEWFNRLREHEEPPKPVRREFVEWLLESPVHVHEYLAITKLWADLEEVDAGPDAGFDGSPAQDDFGPDVLSFDRVTGRGAPIDRRPSSKSRKLLAGIAASIVFAAGVLGALVWSSLSTGPKLEVYRTGLGEQRSIVLEDGSIIELNTLTAVGVAYADDERQVTLIDGEALFDVEENSSRPFVVDTGSASVRVVGTRFNIYKSNSATEVTVLEGKVAIERPAIGGEPPVRGSPSATVGDAVVELLVGEQARFEPRKPQITTATLASIEPVTAWTERRLVFEATPLGEIIAQFNRYNADPLQLGDAALAELELSGVFDSNDPESLIEFLQHVRDVETVRRPDGALVIRSQVPVGRN